MKLDVNSHVFHYQWRQEIIFIMFIHLLCIEVSSAVESPDNLIDCWQPAEMKQKVLFPYFTSSIASSLHIVR